MHHADSLVHAETQDGTRSTPAKVALNATVPPRLSDCFVSLGSMLRAPRHRRSRMLHAPEPASRGDLWTPGRRIFGGTCRALDVGPKREPPLTTPGPCAGSRCG